MAQKPTLEELPVSPRAREIIHSIGQVNYRSELKKMGSLALVPDIRSGAITASEKEIIGGEVAARRKLMTTPAEIIPDEVPESPAALAMPDSISQLHAAVEASAQEREYDARELASAEYKDRV